MKAYHNGPVQDDKRKCTDVYCCVILVVMILGLFIVAAQSWAQNNFTKLTTPYDAEGKGCGVDYPDYPYIYFVAPDYNNLWRTICLKTCPSGTQNTLDCQPNKFVTSCNKDPNADQSIAVNVYSTFPLRKICLPTSETLQASIAVAIGGDSWKDKIITLGKVWQILLAAIPICIVISVILMIFIRLTAGCFVYILLALSMISCIGFGAYMISEEAGSIAGFSFNRVSTYIFGGLLILFGILIAVGVCCFRKRIKLASIIVECSARFVKENCTISFLPLILFVALLVFLAVWILEALGYYSMGTPVGQQEKQWPFQHFEITNLVRALIVLHIFQLFWVVCFLIETNDFIVCGAATSWYFEREHPYVESTHRYSRYHIGSVAMGSFFMALFGFIKFMYELLTPEKTEEQGCMASWKKFCDCCCFLCVSYLFNCFNSGAYTFIHLASETYCSSAWEVLSLRIKEPVSTAVVAFMSVLFSVLIRVGITASTVFLCYIIIKNAEPWKTEVTDATAPNVIVGLLSFTISSFFVSLYSEAMEAIYVCYLADKEAGGSEDKAPAELKEFLLEAKKEANFI